MRLLKMDASSYFRVSHKSAIVHDGDASDGHGFGNRLRPGAVDEDLAVTAEIEAGGAVFFHDLTLHSSHPEPFWRRTLGLDSDVPAMPMLKTTTIRGLSLRRFCVVKNRLNQDLQDKRIGRIRDSEVLKR